MFSQLRGKVREPEAMPDIYSDIELEVVIIIVIVSMINAHLSHRHQYDHLYRHYHDPQYGYPAYSHHDKIPPWWEYVSNDKDGNVSVSKSHHT